MDYVYGLNKSGFSVVKLLKKQNKEFKCWDDDQNIRKKIQNQFGINSLIEPKKENLSKFKNIFLTPGIPIFFKKFKNIVKKNQLKRDLNLYYENIKNERIIAITGTNGKSTTTKLIGEIIKNKSKRTFIGGNIGRPLCNSFINLQTYKYHVIELSSFQLELAKNFNPEISIILNLSVDHLDRYKKMKYYINQKKNIFNLTSTGFNLISLDDKYSLLFSKDKKIKNKITFSIKNSIADIYFKNGIIYDNYFSKNKKIKIKKISKDLQESFNFQNILVAYICTKLFKVSLHKFKYRIMKFKGLPFRSNIIFRSKKLIIINNSKATNITSTINSLESKKNVYLIMGGIAKEINFKILHKFNNKIKKLYLYGYSSSLIYNQVNKLINSKTFINLKNVVDEIHKDVKNLNEQPTILFAPACTSYDQYNSFEERGMHFNQLIKERFKI